MADISKTIGGTTPDYTTVTLFEAALPADITLATGTDEHWIGKARAARFSESVVFSGTTTDATNKVTLTYDSGAGLDGRAREVSSAGAELYSNNASGVIQAQINHFEMDGIDLHQYGTSKAFAANGTYAAGANLTDIKNCILHSSGGSTATPLVGISTADLVVNIENTIAYGPNRTLDSRNAATVTASYCTFWRTAVQEGVLFDDSATVKNCYSGNNAGSTVDFWTSGTAQPGSR